MALHGVKTRERNICMNEMKENDIKLVGDTPLKRLMASE